MAANLISLLCCIGYLYQSDSASAKLTRGPKAVAGVANAEQHRSKAHPLSVLATPTRERNAGTTGFRSAPEGASARTGTLPGSPRRGSHVHRLPLAAGIRGASADRAGHRAPDHASRRARLGLRGPTGCVTCQGPRHRHLRTGRRRLRHVHRRGAARRGYLGSRLALAGAVAAVQDTRRSGTSRGGACASNGARGAQRRARVARAAREGADPALPLHAHVGRQCRGNAVRRRGVPPFRGSGAGRSGGHVERADLRSCRGRTTDGGARTRRRALCAVRARGRHPARPGAVVLSDRLHPAGRLCRRPGGAGSRAGGSAQ